MLAELEITIPVTNRSARHWTWKAVVVFFLFVSYRRSVLVSVNHDQSSLNLSVIVIVICDDEAPQC